MAWPSLRRSIRTVEAMSTPVPPTRRRPEAEPERSAGRIKLITVGAIIAVGLAGGVALAANSGILDASERDGVGDLSASGDLTTPSTQVVDVYLDDTSSTAGATTAPAATAPATTAAVAAGQQFAVDAAGTVTVSAAGGVLRLDQVEPSAGWTWQLAQPDPVNLTVTFTDGARTLHFLAGVAADGSITARVDEPVAAPAAPASTAATSSGGHSGDDDDHEDDGSEHEEYEGGEDDD